MPAFLTFGSDVSDKYYLVLRHKPMWSVRHILSYIIHTLPMSKKKKDSH